MALHSGIYALLGSNGSGKGISIYTVSQANDNGYNCIHIIPYRLSLFAHDIYVKRGESASTEYKCANGYFDLSGDGSSYHFVNGLLVEN